MNNINLSMLSKSDFFKLAMKKNKIKKYFFKFCLIFIMSGLTGCESSNDDEPDCKGRSFFNSDGSRNYSYGDGCAEYSPQDPKPDFSNVNLPPLNKE